MVDGRDAIVIEHVNRMAADLAPEWPTGDRDGTYRIVIEGDPDIECEMAAGDPKPASAGAMVATAMRIVNAVPYVVAAAPGCSPRSTSRSRCRTARSNSAGRTDLSYPRS